MYTQGVRGYLTVNYTGTKSFITKLSDSSTFGIIISLKFVPTIIYRESLAHHWGCIINLSSIVLSLKIPEFFKSV